MKQTRRVVTGHDASGNAVVTEDGDAPVVHTNPLRPGLFLTELWMTDESPARLGNLPDPTHGPLRPTPIGEGSVFRIVEMGPTGAAIEEMSVEDAKRAFALMGTPEASTSQASSRHPLMHRTSSIEYGIILEGKITMVLDESEVVLATGDVFVQRGTNHAWSNRESTVCRMAVVSIPAKE